MNKKTKVFQMIKTRNNEKMRTILDIWKFYHGKRKKEKVHLFSAKFFCEKSTKRKVLKCLKQHAREEVTYE